MEENMDLKTKAFISYWANTIFLKLYNMFYVVDYLNNFNYNNKTNVSNFKEIEDKLEIDDIIKLVKSNKNYHNYIEKRKEFLNQIEINQTVEKEEDLIKYLESIRNYFSHTDEYRLSKKLKPYKYDEKKFLHLILLYLGPEQLREFISMVDNFTITHDKKTLNYYKEKARELIDILYEDKEYKKIINSLYSYQLPNKVIEYFTIVSQNYKPTEILTYDLLLIFLEELYTEEEDKNIINQLKEINTKRNLKKYKGNLRYNNLILSKNVLVQIIAYKVVMEEILEQQKGEDEDSDKKTSQILNLKEIMDKISDTNDFYFEDLKRKVIKGMTKYVADSFENKNDYVDKKREIIKDLYKANDINTFINKSKNYLNNYNLNLPESIEKEKDYEVLLNKMYELFNCSEQKNSNKILEDPRDIILENRVKYIKEKLLKVNELSFSDLKRNAIRGINRYVIAVYETGDKKNLQNHNNLDILNKLYEDAESEPFIYHIKELFEKYGIKMPGELINAFKNEKNYKKLLVKINKFLWKDIISKYENNKHKNYLYKVLKISNPKIEKNNNELIYVKPSNVFKLLFVQQNLKNNLKKKKDKLVDNIEKNIKEGKFKEAKENKRKLKNISKKGYLMYWVYDLYEYDEVLEKSDLSTLSSFDLLLYLLYSKKTQFINRIGSFYNKNKFNVLNESLKLFKLDPKNRKKAVINYIIKSNQTYTRDDMKKIIEYIKNENIEYENLITEIHSVQKAREFIFTMEILLLISVDDPNGNASQILKNYRNAIFHNKRKEIIRFKEREMNKIIKEINCLLEEINYPKGKKILVEYYNKNKNIKNLLKIKTESKVLVKS